MQKVVNRRTRNEFDALVVRLDKPPHSVHLVVIKRIAGRDILPVILCDASDEFRTDSVWGVVVHRAGIIGKSCVMVVESGTPDKCHIIAPGYSETIPVSFAGTPDDGCADRVVPALPLYENAVLLAVVTMAIRYGKGFVSSLIRTRPDSDTTAPECVTAQISTSSAVVATDIINHSVDEHIHTKASFRGVQYLQVLEDCVLHIQEEKRLSACVRNEFAIHGEIPEGNVFKIGVCR